jgi:hypothetical protein
MVVTFLPPTVDICVWQDLTALPSIWTVQAPHGSQLKFSNKLRSLCTNLLDWGQRRGQHFIQWMVVDLSGPAWRLLPIVLLRSCTH